VKSGDVEAAHELGQSLQHSATKASGTKNSRVPAQSTPDQHNDEETLKPGLGGRHGGAITKKNVPYTRGGDKGTSQLLTGERRSKADDAFEAMGTVDELCSVVGVAHAELTERGRDYGELTLYLLEIMSRLFDIGSHVAKPKKTYDSDSDDEGFSADGVGGGFDYHHIEDMEDWIDSYTEALPELTSFILPTGSKSAAQLHVARTVCRRAERRVVPLVQAGVCDPNALKYLNRLSDFFFTAARYINFVEDQAEVLYCLPQKDATQRNRRARNLKQDYKC
jgi:ATP:cob(I)alamin adenosyltransferase